MVSRKTGPVKPPLPTELLEGSPLIPVEYSAALRQAELNPEGSPFGVFGEMMRNHLIYQILTSAVLLAAVSLVVTILSLLAMFMVISPGRETAEEKQLTSEMKVVAANLDLPRANLYSSTANMSSSSLNINLPGARNLPAAPTATVALATPEGTQIIPNTGVSPYNWLPGLLYLLLVGAVLLAAFALLSMNGTPRKKL